MKKPDARYGLATDTALCLPFPLRGGAFMAQVVIPRDLRRHEAEGLSKFLHALVIPEPSPAASGNDESLSVE